MHSRVYLLSSSKDNLDDRYMPDEYDLLDEFPAGPDYAERIKDIDADIAEWQPFACIGTYDSAERKLMPEPKVMENTMAAYFKEYTDHAGIPFSDFVTGDNSVNWYAAKNAYSDEYGIWYVVDGDCMTAQNFIRYCIHNEISNLYVYAAFDYHF